MQLCNKINCENKLIVINLVELSVKYMFQSILSINYESAALKTQ